MVSNNRHQAPLKLMRMTRWPSASSSSNYMKVTSQWIVLLFLTRPLEKQSILSFLSIHGSQGLWGCLCPSKAFNGQVHLRLIFGGCEKPAVLGTSASIPSLGKGELSAVQGDLTSKECTGTWNKGGFLLKETQSVSEGSFVICEWLRVGWLPPNSSVL